ncbi:MAG: glycoside hydrolase family 3 C-terminal domain-containing protein [Clostridia bacterium]|nr:glycoside hydrolase family 3 C-terminal domain-containing protein [Clostridia bacterium]
MYKYEEIINRLTIQQKLSILADVRGFSDSSVAELGIPTVKAAGLADLNKQRNKAFPDFESLANSWDLSLIENVCKNLCATAKQDGVNLFVTPKANAVNSVYEKGMSEDPYLSGKMASACIKAINEMGSMPCVPSLSLSATTIENSDNELNKAALSNYYVKPFEIAARSSSRFAVQIAEDSGEGSYSNANSEMLSVLEKNARKSFYQVVGTSSGEKAIDNVKSHASIILNGSYGALQNAYDKYLKLKAEVESGVMDESELEYAIKNGTAISEEEINEALDKALTFAFACVPQGYKFTPAQQRINLEKDGGANRAQQINLTKGSAPSMAQPTGQANAFINQQAEVICYHAVIKSSVLLKNSKDALPIRRGRIALVGQMAQTGESYGRKTLCQSLQERNEVAVVGYAPGYELSTDRSDELIQSAVQLVNSADVCVLVLGTDERANSKIKNSQSVKLPANQLALLDQLSRTGKPIVAIVSSVYALDMKFESKCSAVLLAPVDGVTAADAIADMICGRANPSGKLSCTRYVDVDERFSRIKNDRNLGKIKIGDMVGYRGYVTTKESVKYPFGYGLSYTAFTYSNFASFGNRFSFTLRNTGSYDGEEVVQIYASARNSIMVRPARALVGFIRVYLKRGESKTVVVNLESRTAQINNLAVEVEKFNFETYNFATGISEAEGCNFDIYVGPNVNEVKKVGNIYNNGKRLSNGGERPADYVTTVTNVVSDGYTLEKTAPRPVPQKSKTWAHVMAILCLISDVMLLMLAMLAATSGLDMITFNPGKSGFGLTVVVTVAINVLLIIAIIKKASGVPYVDHVSIPQIAPVITKAPDVSYDDLFAREFSENVAIEEEEEDTFDDYAAYFDSSIDMPELSNRLMAYSAAFGLKISHKTAISVLSALASSRLVFLRSKDHIKAQAFTAVISKFFESPYLEYEVNNDYYTTDSLLYAKTSADGFEETPVLRAINLAKEDPHKIKVATISRIKAESTSTYLSKCLRYVHNPLKSYKISVDKKITGSVCSIPSNVWFVVCLQEGEFIADLPANVADSATFINLNADIIQPIDYNLNMHAVSYHQFVEMSDLCRGRKQLDEDFWKKVDKFSEYVQSYNETFAITNRSWLQIEKYAGVSLTCGTEEEDVLDMVLSSKIIPSALSVIKASDKENDLTVSHAVEDYFGDKVVSDAIELIKDSGVYRK